MESNHFIGKVAQRALIQNEGKILLVRHSLSDRFSLPGGRLDKDEIPHLGVQREIKEELGLDVEIDGVCSTSVEIYGDGMPTYRVVFNARMIDANQSLEVDPFEVAEIRWVSVDDLSSTDIYESCLADIQRALG